MFRHPQAYVAEVAAIARTVALLDQEMTYRQLCEAVEIIRPGERWHIGHFGLITKILFMVRSNDPSLAPVITTRFINAQTGEPGAGAARSTFYADPPEGRQ
jgi:hypothetical protein